MKNLTIITFIFLLLLICPLMYSQLKVDSDGEVGISGITPTAALHLNNYSWLKFNAPSGKAGLLFWELGTSTSTDVQYGARIYYDGSADGLSLVAKQNGTENQGIFIQRSYGKVGINDKTPSYTLDVDGTIGAYESLLHSDERFKKDITDLNEQEINNLYNLKAKTYTWDVSVMETGIGVESSNDSLPVTGVPNSPDVDETTKIGFIAQELKKYFPNLVKQDDEGFYSINYNALIPVLVEAVKDHQERILYLEDELERLKSDNSSIKSESINNYSSESSLDNSCTLYQNIPNPFSSDTEIKFKISEDVINSTLHIYDMQGTQIRSYNIQERGNSSVTIHGSEFNPGMYLYTLIVDGREINTKRMILTEN